MIRKLLGGPFFRFSAGSRAAAGVASWPWLQPHGMPPGPCPEWCSTWVCDSSAWCLNGQQPEPCNACPTTNWDGGAGGGQLGLVWTAGSLYQGTAREEANQKKLEDTSDSSKDELPLLLSSASDLAWKLYPGRNCWWGGNGAAHEIEEEGQGAPGVASLADCQAACLKRRPACDAILHAHIGGVTRCYRKGGVDIAQCHTDAELNLYRLETPSPPSPPHQPHGSVDAINERFRLGRPSNSLDEAGVLIHQFDNLEDWSNGRGYGPCNSGWCAGRYDHVSFSLINAARPKLFNERAGVMLSPRTPIACSFNADGGTQSSSITAACSIDRAYPPDQLKQMLESQGEGSYNEIVVSSAAWAQGLPDILEAVIFTGYDSQGPEAMTAREVHSAFLQEYASHGRTAENTPLLQYIPSVGFRAV